MPSQKLVFLKFYVRVVQDLIQILDKFRQIQQVFEQPQISVNPLPDNYGHRSSSCIFAPFSCVPKPREAHDSANKSQLDELSVCTLQIATNGKTPAHALESEVRPIVARATYYSQAAFRYETLRKLCCVK